MPQAPPTDPAAATASSLALSSYVPPSPAPPGSTAPDDPLTLGVLHEILLTLAHGAPQEQTLALLAEKARVLTGCASAAIVLRESGGGASSDAPAAVTFAAVAGDDTPELLGTRVLATDTIAGATAQTGETFVAFSPTAPAGAVSENNALGPVRSAAVVPIFAGGKPVGALAALNKNGNEPFAGNDLLALSTLAAGASVALASHQLRAESQRQGRELSLLYEAVRNVSGQISAQEVLDTVVEQVATHVDNCAAVVFLVNDERTHLYIAADKGLENEQRELTLPTDAGLGQAALSASRPLFLPLTLPPEDNSPFAQAPPPAAFESPFPILHARSALAAPIRSGDVVHGLILAVSAQPIEASYTPADANLLGALASQAAVAMENAWLYEDAQRRADEAAALYELSQTVSSTLRLENVLERVADAVLGLLSVDKFALFLHEKRDARLHLVIARGLPPGAHQRLRPAIGQGIPGWVMEFETPTAVQDVAADSRNAGLPLHVEGVVSMTGMPLQVGASTIGVLCALSARRRLFTVAEMELLYTIANQAAIAIGNARIYADVRQKSLELRRYFYRVARALGQNKSPQGVPRLIANLTLEVMGADRCALYRVKSQPDAPGAGAELRLEAAAGFRSGSPAAASLAAGAGEEGRARVFLAENTPTGWVARRARPLTVEDVSDDDRFTGDWPGRGTRGRNGAASYLGVPLRSGTRVIGVREVYTRGPRAWRGDEVRLLLAFASQAAVAFENARLAKESGRAARDARLWRELLLLTIEDPALGGDAAAARLVSVFTNASGTPAWALARRGEPAAWHVVAAGAPPGEPVPAAARACLEEGSAPAPDDPFQIGISPDGRVALVLRRSAAPGRDENALLRAGAIILAKEPQLGDGTST